MAVNAPPAAPFSESTRLKKSQLADIARPVGGGASLPLALPKTGLLFGLFLAIRGSVAGTLSAPNALGMASIVRRVRLNINSGHDLVSFSGAGYHYGLREMLDAEYIDPGGASNARSAVTAATFNLDMFVPVCVNLRDPVGAIMLQNEATVVQLHIEWETDAVVATGATVTGTVTPYMLWFTVPPDPRSMPNLSILHQIVEDARAVGAAGEFEYNWLRGNNYIQVFHGMGIGAAGADTFSRVRLRINQSDYIQESDVKLLDMEHRLLRGRARPAGGIYLDFLGTSGLGNYGLTRDFIDSSQATDIASVLTATGATTLYTIRRQLIVMQ